MQYFFYRPTTTIDKDLSFTCKGSKFLTFLYPLPTLTKEYVNENIVAEKDSIESINKLRNDLIVKLQAIHKKAVHFVWAFRILNEYDHVVEGSSDDGEPKGSAGVPILEVLRGKCLVNILCVCVRYFGGTKLGIGGLVRAYTQATLQVIDYAYTQGNIIAHKKQSTITINDKSSAYNKILHLAKKYQLTIIHKDFFQADMILTIRGEVESIDNFLHEKTSM